LAAAGNAILTVKHEPGGVTLVPPDTYMNLENTSFDSLI
jgi:hypothetical protein